MLYPQNGDRIVAIDSVTSPYVYKSTNSHTLRLVVPYLILLDSQKRQFLRALLSFYDCDVS